MKVLIAGGAGFIGSTVASKCLDAGITPVLLDNLVTGRIEFTRDRAFYQGDIADGELVDTVFREHPDIDAVILAAALIVVPESVEQPLRYYRENVSKAIEFVEHLVRNGCRRLIFSSSAAVYKPGDDFSVDEESELDPQSPYARTKAALEVALRDIAAGSPLRVLSFRYFNPIGTDPKLRTGLALEKPSHALGKMIDAWRTGESFAITGTDWPTRDGTGLRDYVHVWDLAAAHVKAIEAFDAVLGDDAERYRIVNLGTGEGTTVRELLDQFNSVAPTPVRAVSAPRRPGDTAGAYASGGLARQLLDWTPTLSVAQGIADTLAWFDIRDTIIGR